MTRAALIKDGTVVNVVELPDDWTGRGTGDWPVPEGHSVVLSEKVCPGDEFDGVKFFRTEANDEGIPERFDVAVGKTRDAPKSDTRTVEEKIAGAVGVAVEELREWRRGAVTAVPNGARE